MYCTQSGSGPDVVLLHGWAWHGGVWGEVAATLARAYRVWVPDLPGHGRSRTDAGDYTLDGLAKSVSECVPAASVWIGWSLGGLIALAAAHAGLVRRLVLLGATPRFTQDADWPCGWSVDWFERFNATLVSDTGAALERFASLHRAGVGNERPLLRRLRAQLVGHGAPTDAALQAGLRVLGQADMRAQLATVTVPALVLHGECDQLVPMEAGLRLARALPQARFVGVAGAGHALFLSHAGVFVDKIGEFLSE